MNTLHSTEVNDISPDIPTQTTAICFIQLLAVHGCWYVNYFGCFDNDSHMLSFIRVESKRGMKQFARFEAQMAGWKKTVKMDYIYPPFLAVQYDSPERVFHV